MQDPRAFNIDKALLDTKSEPSDRFVYSVYYIPFDPKDPDKPAILPAYKVSYLARWAAIMPVETRQKVLRKYPKLLELANKLAQGWEALPLSDAARASEAAKDVDREALRLYALLREPEMTLDTREAMEASVRRILASSASVSVPRSGAVVHDPSTVTETEQLAGAFASEIGFLFLDRTRIRPAGFAVGEHLMSLSLAPGEEVTIEQRVFSKREASYEELTDTEETLDLEMSSTLTGELTEGLDREQSRTTRETTAMGTRLSGQIYGVNVELGPSNADSVDEGNRETLRRSVKNSRVASSKVASRHRSQHKITFRVSTEARFESTSRRVFRNPNPYTPIDLFYFKILQRLQLTQERYGLRLCWSPAVEDPARNFEKRLEAVKKRIFDRAKQGPIGPAPVKPPPPPESKPETKEVTVTKDASDKIDKVNGSQRYDHVVVINAPQGFTWDGGVDFINGRYSFSFSGTRPHNNNYVKTVEAFGSSVKVTVHIGIENWVWVENGQWKSEIGVNGNPTFSVTARFESQSVPQNPDYQKALSEWEKAFAEWQAKVNAAKAAEQKAEEEWQAYRQEALSKINPIHETMIALIVWMFPSPYRDDIWEIDLWERIFDWDNAGVRFYPSWWVNKEPRDPKAGTTDFLNASWARLFLPIRPGAEEMALRWIIGVTQTGSLPTPTEQFIKELIKSVREFREKHFGDPGEVAIERAAIGDCPVSPDKYICMAKWEEMLPTDGTHLEVLQATTSATDDDSLARLADAVEQRKQQNDRMKKENDLRQAAINGGLGATTTEVRFTIGGEDE
jgi:hypothetical protein